MNREVTRMANIIKAMGVKRGDRVTIYMGRVPEIVFAMLACAKIGAIHSVVFGGFSVDSLAGRIEDSQVETGHHLRRLVPKREDRRTQTDRG
jgi:acetyl-CoA synthetase